MKITKIAAVLLMTLPMIGISQSALADHTEACQLEVATVRATIWGADFANDREQARLSSKADAASMKLYAHKPYDAIDKLGDIAMKVEALAGARKTKIDAGDAEDILADVNDAVTCIYNNLGSF